MKVERFAKVSFTVPEVEGVHANHQTGNSPFLITGRAETPEEALARVKTFVSRLKNEVDKA